MFGKGRWFACRRCGWRGRRAWSDKDLLRRYEYGAGGAEIDPEMVVLDSPGAARAKLKHRPKRRKAQDSPSDDPLRVTPETLHESHAPVATYSRNTSRRSRRRRSRRTSRAVVITVAVTLAALTLAALGSTAGCYQGSSEQFGVGRAAAVAPASDREKNTLAVAPLIPYLRYAEVRTPAQ
jgi:hypothetical protein